MLMCNAMCVHLILFLVLFNAIDGTERDVVFVLDKSGSVAQSEFDEAIDFVYNVTKWLTIGPSNIQISAVTFSSSYSEEFDLDDYSDNTTLLNAIENLKSISTGGGTYTFDALQYVRSTSLTSSHGARTNVPKAVVVLTDGLSASSYLTALRAEELKNDGVEVYAIGIGNAAVATNTELEDIASDPDSYYLHTVDMFQYLCALVPELVPKLDNETLNSDFFRCPTPSPVTTTTFKMTFLNVTKSSSDDSSAASEASSASSTTAIIGAVAGVAALGLTAGAVLGVVKYLNALKAAAQISNPFVEAIVAQYSNAPLGQGKPKFNHKFDSFGIPLGPVITSKPPVITAWK